MELSEYWRVFRAHSLGILCVFFAGVVAAAVWSLAQPCRRRLNADPVSPLES